MNSFETKLINSTPFLRDKSRLFEKREEDQQDLVQETLIKALRYKDRLLDESNIVAWLYVVMRSVFFNKYKKESKHPCVPIDENYMGIKVHPIDLDNKSILEIVNKNISQLPEDTRRAFNLNIEGFKYREISEILNIPVGTVKSKIFSVRKELRGIRRDFISS